MVNYCNVLQCHNRSDREVDRSFFRIPAIIRNQGSECEELSGKRRRAWLSSLNQDFSGKNLGNVRVCSDHFLTGEPAYLYKENHPDWIPTLKMGHAKVKSSNSSQQRYERFSQRNIKTQAWIAAADLLAAQETCVNLEPEVECAVPDVEIQTELTGNQIAELSLELEQLRFENAELRNQIALSKMSLTDLKGRDEKVKFLTGLSSYDVLNILLKHVDRYLPNKKSMTNFQMLLMTLMRIRLNLSEQLLAFQFSVSQSTICRIFSEVVDVLYARTKVFVRWPERAELYNTMPMEFRRYFGKNVAVIIDCFEIFIERPSNLMARAQTWSSYKHHNTVKFLMGITPQGSVSYISKAWGGRVTDKYITEHSGFLNNILPGDVVLADRGFDIKDTIGSLCAEVKIPAFTKGKDQLSPLELESTRKIAHCRIHVERVIGCVRQKYTILSSIIPIHLLNTKDANSLTMIDKICHVCCSLTNMCEPIVCFD